MNTSVDAPARVWAWQHEPAFEQQSIAQLHQIGKTILPYATVLCLGYTALDYASAPAEVLTLTLLLRGLMVGFLAFCSAFLLFTQPGRWTTLVCASAPVVSALLVIVMSVLWEPGVNLYGSGIVVPMTAYVILTRKPIHTLLGVVVVVVAYPLANVLYQAIPAQAMTAFVTHMVIVSGTCLLIVLISVMLHQLRWKAFCQQQQLAAERDTIASLAANLEVRVEERTRQLQQSNAVFARFVPTEFLGYLGHRDMAQVQLGDTRKTEMTVLFANLENLSLINEVLGAQQTMAVMNRVLAQWGPCVRKHGGFVGKFIGDSTLALFPGGAQQAQLAALEMGLALQDALVAGELKNKITVGMGLHIGSVLLGTLGEAERFEVVAMGDTVNVAEGIQSLARVLGASVLLSASTYQALVPAEQEHCRWLGAFTLKGRTQAVEVYESFAHYRIDYIPVIRSHRSAFEQALRDYFAGQVVAAHAVLEAIAEDCPWDKALQFWLKKTASDARMGYQPQGSVKHY
jgi:class 3 adenylate cyclase